MKVVLQQIKFDWGYDYMKLTELVQYKFKNLWREDSNIQREKWEKERVMWEKKFGKMSDKKLKALQKKLDKKVDRWDDASSFFVSIEGDDDFFKPSFLHLPTTIAAHLAAIGFGGSFIQSLVDSAAISSSLGVVLTVGMYLGLLVAVYPAWAVISKAGDKSFDIVSGILDKHKEKIDQVSCYLRGYRGNKEKNEKELCE